MSEEFVVTPWEVRGRVDYSKLINQFGLQLLTDELLERLRKHTGDLHLMLRRRIFFAHRSLDWLLSEYEKGNMFYLYTGRGPSEHIHLGHLVPFILTKWLQEKFGAKLYVQITDDEKFLFKPLSYEQVRKYAYDNVLDIIALGFDPEKTRIFLDTEYAKTLYREAIKVAKKITYSTIRAAFGLGESSNIGQIFFTSMQAVPAILESVKQGRNVPCLIPLAVDQDPHFRVARDVLPKLGFYKPAIIHAKFLPSLTGEAKMSSSEAEAAIFTVDSPEDVKKKIWNAFTGGQPTIKEQREKGGNPEICSVYQYFYFLFEPDDRKVRELYFKCKQGEVVCGDCKAELAKRVIAFLEEHQRKREEARDLVDKFMLRD